MRDVLQRASDRIDAGRSWGRAADQLPASVLLACVVAFNRVNRSRCVFFSSMTGGGSVKVVVWKSPKYLRGILSRLFHVT